jgi:Flp pilus assembly protein TadD
VAWAWTSTSAANWHPVTWLSHLLDVELFGVVPGPHHWMSVSLHALAALLLFVALVRMTAATLPSAFVAALFAVHPLHVESVAWVAERKNLVSTVCWMACLIAYARYARRPGRGAYALVAITLAVGLLAKPMLVTVPMLLLLLDVWPLRRVGAERVSRLVVEKLPLLALSIASVAITVAAQRASGAMRDVAQVDVATRLANAAGSYWRYLGHALWPADLSPYYPYAATQHAGLVALATAGLVLVSAAAWAWRRRAPYLFTGWFWYVGTLVPVIGIVQVGSQAMADRYTYVPLIGMFIVVAWGLPDLVRSWRPARVVVPAAAVAVVVACVVATRAQTAIWRDSVTLWSHAVAVEPDNYFAHGALGAALKTRGRTAEARRHLERALALRPDLDDVHTDLGTLLAAQGDRDAALRHLREAVRLNPRFAEAHHNLGVALTQAGDRAAAAAAFRDALRLNPDLPRTHHALARLLAADGRVAEALPHFLDAVRLSPHAVELRYNAALALSTLGRRDEALRELDAALAIDPRHEPSRAMRQKIGAGR